MIFILRVVIVLRTLPILLFFGFIAAAQGHEAPNSDGLEQKLFQLQRRGSCVDLPNFGAGTHRGRNPDGVNVRLASEINARIVRIDLPWADTERDGHFDFGVYDNLIGQLRAAKISVMLILDYGHPAHSDGFAQNGVPLPPRSPEQRAAFSRYVQAVAARYHGADVIYEIWNEPNLDLFWPPHFNVTSYGQLLIEAINAVRQVRPSAVIIAPGLANLNNPPQFLDTLATLGALGGLDGISFHPYRRDGPESSLVDIAAFRAAAGPQADRPLWFTEWGYSESWLAGRGKDARTDQASMVARLMLTGAIAKAKAVLVYDLIDDGKDPHDQEATFGLYDYDFRPKPAAAAFRSVATAMANCDTYEFKVDAKQGVAVAAFEAGTNASIIIWAYRASAGSDFCFSLPAGRPLGLQNLEGSSLTLATCGSPSMIKVPLSEARGPAILRADGVSSK